MLIDGNDEKNFLLSIVVPVYNVEKYLDRCMDSLLNQNIENYEIILVDDGATDNSGLICDKYSQEYFNVKVIHKKNEGLGLTRNVGIDNSKGQYIMFVDSDDYIEKNCLFGLYQYVKKNNSDVCFFHRAKYLKNGVVKESQEMFDCKCNTNELIGLCLGEPLKKDLFEIGPAWKAIYNRKFLQEKNIKFKSEREILSEDYIFSAEVCAKANVICFYDKTIYYYCDNEQSLTNSYRSDRYKKAVVLYKEMHKIAEKYKLTNNEILRMDNNFLINMLVCFKHISLSSGMNKRNKLSEIKKICKDEDVNGVLLKITYADSLSLKILKKLMLKTNSRMIYILMRLRYH